MDNWKRAVLAGSAGAAVAMFFKGKTGAGLIFTGLGMAILASEYPEKFAELRKNLPDYVERGTEFLEVVSRAGERLAEATENHGIAWYDALVRG